MNDTAENVVKEYEPGDAIEISFRLEHPTQIKGVAATFVDADALDPIQSNKRIYLRQEYDHLSDSLSRKVNLSKVVDANDEPGVYKLWAVFVKAWGDTLIDVEGAPTGALIRIKPDPETPPVVSEWQWERRDDFEY